MQEYLINEKENCSSCYKCIRACPVKAIRFTGNQAHIIPEECILCGKCYVVCPQNSIKVFKENLQKVKTITWDSAPVYASVAPSFASYFEGVTIDSMDAVLRKLGFAGAEETALGAAYVKTEYENLIKNRSRDIIISSSCNTVNMLIQRHYPKALTYLANKVSPMEAHAIDIKRRHPQARVVFIGPCISKMQEAEIKAADNMDGVMTFDDLEAWMAEQSLEFEAAEDNNDETRTRIFPIPGGILKSMDCSDEVYKYMSVSGVNECISVLEEIEAGTISHCFIEMSACEGSCSGGPIIKKHGYTPFKNYLAITKYAGSKDYPMEPMEEITLNKMFNNHYHPPVEFPQDDIREIMLQMGKKGPVDELNCGTCGYSTCLEHANAILAGNSDVSACLPFLTSKAETFSDNIIRNIHYGVVVLNEYMEIQQMNKAAMNLFNIRTQKEIMGERIDRILDSTDFAYVFETGQEIRNRRTFLVEYQKYVDETIIYDPEVHIIICMMRDVTKEENKKEQKEAHDRQMAEIADKMVEKQMRIVQEIASLLGETTAETKIAITRLKETISDE